MGTRQIDKVINLTHYGYGEFIRSSEAKVSAIDSRSSY